MKRLKKGKDFAHEIQQLLDVVVSDIGCDGNGRSSSQVHERRRPKEIQRNVTKSAKVNGKFEFLQILSRGHFPLPSSRPSLSVCPFPSPLSSLFLLGAFEGTEKLTEEGAKRGICLQDLVFLDDGNSDMIEGLINFRKREMIYKVIDDILQFQSLPYNIQVEPTIFSLLRDPFFREESELWNVSLEREPKDAVKSDLE